MSAVARVIKGKSLVAPSSSSEPSAPSGPVPPQEAAPPGSPAQRDESDLAARTSASLRARRRGGGRQSLLGTSDTQSTLG
jgi:hypothetical protein